ncbi:hypothetical protein ACE7GA_15740 [Roseomonas sp. CCTCC AB2023176]|uniref:hypothetical protein n=1 Tax=Roseomonas sp. CCTCC AB2023176 TaxID=3342640 RepID=UPI0035DF84CD
MRTALGLVVVLFILWLVTRLLALTISFLFLMATILVLAVVLVLALKSNGRR